MKIEMVLKFDRAAKNTYIFVAKNEYTSIPTIYVRKSAFEKQPKKLKLISEGE